MSSTLSIVNDAPCGSERACNGLRPGNVVADTGKCLAV